MIASFIHLHVHSNYSFCRGGNSIEQICAAAKQMGATHIALTDTNGLYGLVWFLDAAKKYGLQPIIGSYLETDQHHCLLLAKNQQGYQYLSRLISALHCDEKFDLAGTLVAERQNVVAITDDLALLEKLVQARSLHDLYAEIIPHANREKLLRFARAHAIPPVATNAVYFVAPEDWQTHRLLRAIDLNTTFSRLPQREVAHRDAFLKTPQQMIVDYPDCPEAVRNTQKIAIECTFNLEYRNFIFTSFKGPDGEDAQTILKRKVVQGIKWRYGGITEKIKKRLDYELGIIGEKNFAPYFLVVADIVQQAPRTCGRGSAAASLVSYTLGITHVDPIKYDLFFDRFLNPGRKDPPDIDVDFPWDERDDILDYIFRKYGAACTAMISNHNTFKARSAVREVAKVYGLPDKEIGDISKKISSYWQPHDIWELTQTHPIFSHTELKEPWPEIIALAEKIRGFPRHLSVHCGGVVIAPDGLDKYVPVQPAKKILSPTGLLREGSSGLPREAMGNNNVLVTQWEKDQAEEMGLVKMDILGNRSLAVVRDALAAIKRNYGIVIDYARWNPLDDPATQEMIARGETIGVFYVESPAMRLLQQKTGKGDFEHLVIHSSIIRPAANTYINEYIRRLKGGSYQPLHPLLEDLLHETYGIMVYQEDISKVAMALANFSAAEADDLRKIISKKHKKKQLEDYREQFYIGARRNGVSQETCDRIWNMILSFAGYSFCKPHSASYALLSFKSAYLRAHYPAEFMAAVISNQGGYYSTFAYISEARRMGLKVLMPDINASQREYSGINKEIRVGFMQLKNLTESTIDKILQERDRNGPYRSFEDFLARVHIGQNDATILVKAGCFDAVEPKKTRPELLWQLHLHHSRQHKTADSGTLSLFDDGGISDRVLPKSRQYDERTILRHEIETIGFLLSRHPLSLYQDKINRLNYVKACDLKRYAGKKVRTIGWFITGKLVSTRRKEMMEFMSFEDTTAIYETVFFPRTYAQFIHMIDRQRPYVLEGVVDEQYGAVTLNVQKVSLL